MSLGFNVTDATVGFIRSALSSTLDLMWESLRSCARFADWATCRLRGKDERQNLAQRRITTQPGNDRSLNLRKKTDT